MNVSIPKLLTQGLFTILLVLSGCATLNTNPSNPKKVFPVTVSFSKEMGDVDPVNVNVTIDGKDTVINRDFSNRGNSWTDTTKAGAIIAHIVSPPPHWDYNLTLSGGIHQIEVTSKNGDAGLDVIFNVDKPIWLYLSYWGKNHFQLHISDHKMGYM